MLAYHRITQDIPHCCNDGGSLSTSQLKLVEYYYKHECSTSKGDDLTRGSHFHRRAESSSFGFE